MGTSLRFHNLNFYNLSQRAHWLFRRALGRKEPLPNYATACPSCFHDHGLKRLSSEVAVAMLGRCPNCKRPGPQKLRLSELQWLMHTFFVWGTYQRPKYGGYPAVQMNQHQKTSVSFSSWLEPDVRLFEKWFGMGFFHYGPRFWMFGEITPLKEIMDLATREKIVERIVTEYPILELPVDTLLYRLRKQPANPSAETEYDSPPAGLSSNGRLESVGLPIMYASTDLSLCIYECRVTAEDDIYAAALNPRRPLKLLDLTHVLKEDVTEFESLDLAIHMLFLAGAHSYDACRAIAIRAHALGFDGLNYPSYFSFLRTGAMPFMTSYGLSHRIIEQLQPVERAKIVANVALFGYPLASDLLSIKGINRVMIHSIDYNFHFGPAKYS